MKKNEKSWLQLQNENDKHYELFNSFLKFEGTVEQFISSDSCNASKSTVNKIATNNKWHNRKNSYQSHNQNTAQKVKDKTIAKIEENAIKKSLEEFEKSLPILTQQYVDLINDPAIPKLDKKVLEFVKILPDTIERFLRVKDRLGVETKSDAIPTFVFVGEMSDIIVKPIEEDKDASDKN